MACPDSNKTKNGMKDVKTSLGEIKDGTVRICYTRLLNTGKYCKE